ncbi:MAG TPA: CPBP family intramembrane glutamic endopeptidase [bacterium]|nr:CPBP family intramembrane glutamic endopeptidase [bacterium]
MDDGNNGRPLWGGESPEPGSGPASSPIPPPATLPPLAPPPRPPGPWGVWATLGWMVLMIGSTVAASIAAIYPYLLWTGTPLGSARSRAVLDAAVKNGDFLWINYLVTIPVLGAVLVLALLLRPQYPARLYLAFRNTGLKNWIIWPAALLVFSFGSDALLYYLHLNPVADWMTDVYDSARCFPCLMLAIILLAPLLEELVFRGFVFTGIQARLGPFWAVALSALPWALMHVQYQAQWYFMLLILLIGILLGLARWRTNSLLIPLAMHILQNSLASVEMWLFR